MKVACQKVGQNLGFLELPMGIENHEAQPILSLSLSVIPV